MNDQALSGALVAHQASAGKGPARGYSWPAAGPGNGLALRHGGFSAQRIGQRAREVLELVLELNPHLDAPENALALSAYSMARARLELLSAAVEAAVAQTGAVKLGARIVEAATSASREEAAQRASLGLDPRSLAELRQISTLADLNQALLSQLVPELPAAIGEALVAIGAGDQTTMFMAAFVGALRRGGEEEEQ